MKSVTTLAALIATVAALAAPAGAATRPEGRWGIVEPGGRWGIVESHRQPGAIGRWGGRPSARVLARIGGF